MPLKRRYAQPGDLAATIDNLAVVQADRGALDAALNSLAEAEQIYREHQHLTGVSQVLINRGKFLTSLGQLDGAQAAYEEALQTIEHTSLMWETPSALNGLANVLRRRGDLNAASETYQRALAAAQHTGDVTRQEQAVGNLGLVEHARPARSGGGALSASAGFVRRPR